MDKKNLWILVLLVISLVLNVMSFQEIRQTRSQMALSLHQTENWMNSRIQDLYRRLDREGQGMEVRDVTFTVRSVDTGPDRVAVSLRWTLMARETGSHVYLLCRGAPDRLQTESREWTSIPALEKGLNQYEVLLLLDPQDSYEYQILESGNSTVLSDPSWIPDTVYRRPDAAVSGGGSYTSGFWGQSWTLFEIGLAEYPLSLVESFRISGIQVWGIHADGEKVELNTELFENEDGQKSWGCRLFPNEKGKMVQKVQIRVEYADGHWLEKDITSEVMELYQRES